MNAQHSRRWRNAFIVEFVLIVVPYAALAAFMSVATIVPSFSIGLVDLLLSTLIASALAVPLGCGIRLSATYLAGGRERLLCLNRFWWYGAALGALIPLGGLFAYLLWLVFGDFPIEPTAADSSLQPFGPARIGELSLAAAAAPLLLPLSHLWIERRRAARAATAHLPDIRS